MQTCTVDTALSVSHGTENGVVESSKSRQITGQQTLQQASVMIVDDEPINVEVVQVYLEEAGYRNFITESNSTRAIDLLYQERPDVLLLDLMMPEVSGFDIMMEAQSCPELKRIPILVLTSSTDAGTKLKALELGATDFLSKPIDPSELALRLKNTLSARAYQNHLEDYSVILRREVRMRTADLERAQEKIILCLGRAAEFRDDDTGQHVIRVGRYAGIVARGLGFNEQWSAMIEQAAQLHDVGKIGIPDAILLKPGRLDPQEFQQMQEHCEIGSSIIQAESDAALVSGSAVERLDLDELDSEVLDAPVMRMASSIAYCHHEKWDGSGYPRGLKGTAIPIEARITAVADVFDALGNKRPYKVALEKSKCYEIIEEGRGKHFDPQVVDAFFARINDIERVCDERSK